LKKGRGKGRLILSWERKEEESDNLIIVVTGEEKPGLEKEKKGGVLTLNYQSG